MTSYEFRIEEVITIVGNEMYSGREILTPNKKMLVENVNV